MSDHQVLPGSDVGRLRGKRAAMVVFSYYPMDPRPRRAAEALVREGMKVELICLRESSRDLRRERVNGVDVHRVPLRRRRGGPVGYVIQYMAFLSSVMTRLSVRSVLQRYDLVYVHNMPDILVLSALIPRIFGAKVILDLHDPMPELMMTIFGLSNGSASVRMLKKVESWSIGLTDRAITVNEACRSLFVSRSCDTQKVQVIMNSPDEDIFRLQPPSVTPVSRVGGVGPFVVMYHGSLVERNGLDIAVDAVAKVRADLNVQLRVYGTETPFLRTVMAMVRSKCLDERVHYLGPRSSEEIVEEIGECSVGVIPNRRNVFTELNTPTRIFEYLALGKAVVAPRARGIQDYFDEESLIFFELGDSEDLARRLEHACLNPERVLKVVERGQKVYVSHRWCEERRRLIDAVADVLGEGGATNRVVGSAQPG